MNLLPLAEAQQHLLALAPVLDVEEAALADAFGRYLAEPVLALRTQPEADLSAMDGWAVRGDALPGPFRWNGLESAAGRPLKIPVAPGEAARIFTGAVMPAGTDRVVMQEFARLDEQHVLHVNDTGPTGSNVRRRGMDFSIGDMLGQAGAYLNPALLALLATGGYGRVKVRRRPRVTLFSTGDELAEPGAPISDGGLPASNGIMLAALARQAGADVTDLGIVRDDSVAIGAAFDTARAADLVITSGGVSVGDHDLVRPVLQAMGAQIDFWRIALKPGKPLMAGRLGGTLVLGLPGNPVSAFVTAHLFALPLIRALAGSGAPLPFPEHARAAVPLRATGKRAEFLRAALVDGTAVPLDNQDSAALTSLAAAQVLIHRSANSPALPAGAEVEVLRIA
jgi:molybdopterin molybdotransferase